MITLTINSVDRTSEVDQQSIRFEQAVTKSPSTLSFSIKKGPNKNIPDLGDEVVLTEDAVDLFKGTVVERSDDVISGLLLSVTITCKDGLHLFDALLVNKAYSATTVGAVVADIVSTFTTGFTLDIPASTPPVTSVRFNYEHPSRCLQLLAEQIGWDWYIDASYVVHFFKQGNETAPFEVTDTNGKAVFGSLSFNSNILELKNSVFLRGGEYLDAVSEGDALDKYTADGQQVVINLGYKYNSIQVTVNGVAKTVGTDFLHDPADYDCLYNFQEKLLRFREDNKPTAGQIVKAFGNVYIPLIVQAEDGDSILAYGRREGIKIDKTITSVLEAEQAVTAVLDQWSEGSYEGSFKTREKGLRAGQQITITSDIFDVDNNYKINRVSGRMNGHDSFEYDVQFIKSGNVNFTDIMVDLLGRERKNITIADNETIQRLRKFTESFGATDELVAITKTTGPYVYGGGSPQVMSSSSVVNTDGGEGVETDPWTNPGNAATSNDVYATCGPGSMQKSDFLDATNFGFSIPATATIVGIKVEYEAKAALANRAYYSKVQLIVAGGATGTNLGDNSYIPVTEAYKEFGGATTMWGLSLTPAQVNAINFGVRLQFRTETLSTTVSVDHVRITVYYQNSVGKYNFSTWG